MSSPLPPDYAERVYAGWIGKCIGVRLGAPLENWTYDEIRANLGEVTDFLPLPPGKLFKPDDDTAFPLVLIRALQDYGPQVTAAEMGETVLNYLGDQRGTFWWGGYGVSSEHTAYVNLASGIPAPRSGSIELNGQTLAEQIGGQIFSDIWGLVAPDNPQVAAAYAERAASITHAGEGLAGARFIAGLVSMAFAESDPRTLVTRGLALVDAASEYARVVRAVLDFHAGQPDDWRACYAFIKRDFGYDRYPGTVHIIPNTAIVVMALLYGNGDFSRTVQIATMGGWDTDCNAGNVGAIMGTAVGLAGIDMHWRSQMNDLLVGASIVGARNLTDLPACADLFVSLGAQVAGVAPSPRPRLHFDYPGATHGAQGRAQLAEIVDLRQQEGALKIVLRGLKKKGEALVFWKTYCRPRELSANYYGASFSPKLYPGQTVTARLWAPATAENLLAALYVWDDNHAVRHQALATTLRGGEWNELHFQIPALANSLLAEVGVVLRTLGEAWDGYLLLDALDWAGAPHFSTDFQAERGEYGAISQWTLLRGSWRKERDGYHGSAATVGESYTGNPDWQDLRVRAGIMPLAGDHHNINLRVQGARRSYAVGLAPAGRLAIYKNSGGYLEVASLPYPWRHGNRYEITVMAAGDLLTVTTADGSELVWRDEHAPYLAGMIGLSTFAGSHSCYTDLHVAGHTLAAPAAIKTAAVDVAPRPSPLAILRTGVEQ